MRVILSPSPIVLRWCSRRWTCDATFGVAVDGGAGPGKGAAATAAAAVSADPEGALTVSVGEAAPGSGSGKLGPAQAVKVNSPGIP